MNIVRLIDGDKLEQRLLDEAARIMAEDLYGKDRQRMARGLQKAAEICRATETASVPIEKPIHLDTEEVAKIVTERLENAGTIYTDSPIVEYAPVRHGRWLIEPYVGKHATLKVLRCSECDNPVLALPDGQDYNYCPNCGALMQGGAEDVEVRMPL